MTLVGADGKPIQKKWEEMTSSEQMGAIRQGMGWIIHCQEQTNKKLDYIVNTIKEMEAEDKDDEARRRESAKGREEEIGTGTEPRSNDAGANGADAPSV